MIFQLRSIATSSFSASGPTGMPAKRAMDWAQEQVALAVKGQLKVG